MFTPVFQMLLSGLQHQPQFSCPQGSDSVRQHEYGENKWGPGQETVRWSRSETWGQREARGSQPCPTSKTAAGGQGGVWNGRSCDELAENEAKLLHFSRDRGQPHNRANEATECCWIKGGGESEGRTDGDTLHNCRTHSCSVTHIIISYRKCTHVTVLINSSLSAPSPKRLKSKLIKNKLSILTLLLLIQMISKGL